MEWCNGLEETKLWKEWHRRKEQAMVLTHVKISVLHKSDLYTSKWHVINEFKDLLRCLNCSAVPANWFAFALSGDVQIGESCSNSGGIPYLPLAPASNADSHRHINCSAVELSFWRGNNLCNHFRTILPLLSHEYGH
jgi:hypothetical protein